MGDLVRKERNKQTNKRRKMGWRKEEEKGEESEQPKVFLYLQDRAPTVSGKEIRKCPSAF